MNCSVVHKFLKIFSLQHVTGPDFPTKGIIMGRSGIRAAYATGRGKIILRARTEFEEFGRDRTRIIAWKPFQSIPNEIFCKSPENPCFFRRT